MFTRSPATFPIYQDLDTVDCAKKALIGPLIGISKDNQGVFLFSYTVKWAVSIVFESSPEVLEGFLKLWEACRNHFHLFWYVSDAVVTSYSQNPGWKIFLLSIEFCHIFAIFLTPDLSSWSYIQFGVEYPKLQSEIAKSFIQNKKHKRA